jgi:hypothetical protein
MEPGTSHDEVLVATSMGVNRQGVRDDTFAVRLVVSKVERFVKRASESFDLGKGINKTFWHGFATF